MNFKKLFTLQICLNTIVAPTNNIIHFELKYRYVL